MKRVLIGCGAFAGVVMLLIGGLVALNWDVIQEKVEASQEAIEGMYEIVGCVQGEFQETMTVGMHSGTNGSHLQFTMTNVTVPDTMTSQEYGQVIAAFAAQECDLRGYEVIVVEMVVQSQSGIMTFTNSKSHSYRVVNLKKVDWRSKMGKPAAAEEPTPTGEGAEESDEGPAGTGR